MRPLDIFCTILGNLRKSGRKSSENCQIRHHHYVYIIKEHYTLARRYEFYVLVARTISHSFAAFTREILFLPREHKIHLLTPCAAVVSLWKLKPPVGPRGTFPTLSNYVGARLTERLEANSTTVERTERTGRVKFRNSSRS